MKNIILHRKARYGNEHSRNITTTQSGAGLDIKPSSRTTTTARREWSCENIVGTREKPSKTTTSTQKGCPCQHRHVWLGQGTSYLADKTLRASPARGTSLDVDRPLCQQTKTTRRWPSKTIPGPKISASKTMQKQELDSSGKETEGGCERMDGYNPGPLCVGHNTRASVTIQSEAPLIKPTSKSEVKVPKAQDSMMTSEVSPMLSEDTIELGPGKKGFFTYPFLILRENVESHFIMNLKPLNQYINCTKFKMTTLKQGRPFIQDNGQSHLTSS